MSLAQRFVANVRPANNEGDRTQSQNAMTDEQIRWVWSNEAETFVQIRSRFGPATDPDRVTKR